MITTGNGGETAGRGILPLPARNQLHCKICRRNGKRISTYDPAGKTVLKNIDGEYQRTVYDNYGRTIQEIDDSDYNPEIDDIPNAYPDTSTGHRYVYNNAGQLIKEINKYDLETDYTYSSIGKLSKKHFDVYDYYYSNDGSCCKVEVNGAPVVSYDYNVTDSDITISDGQQINRMTYADGYTEEQVTDENGTVKSKYSGGSEFYNVSVANSVKVEYNDLELDHVNTYKTTENGVSYSQQTSDSKTMFGYGIETQDDVQTISETHFGTNNYQTVISNNTASFTSPSSSYEYNIVSNDGFSTEQIKDDSTVVLSADTTYNEDNDIISKSYGNNLVFTAAYDDSGNIIADENRNYTYNEHGEMVSVSGSDNSSYTYDDRGNMLTKTVDGQTTEFAYNNTQWQDQLTSVNGTPLTYDLNGNLTAYGNTQYSWSRGKQLSSITDGENSYTYQYDSKGIRASKTVNGVTTNYDTLDGRILAQYDGTNNIYFQYNGNSPVGFILNNVQYYYITNLYGDIMGIADSDGSVIARYSYDEWGKLLDIATAQENSEEQMAIAELNPLRYRGYYYDNETGMYYLQSRYYNPDLCRFISADGFDYINTSNLFSSNAYAYCWNNPVAFDDIEGTAPQISIDMQKVVSFFKNANDKALQKFSEHIEKLQIKFNAFIEKAKYYLLNPDELINNTLSKIFGKEVKIKFHFIEKIKEFIDDLTENFVEFDKLNGSNGPQNEEESLDCEENLICFSTYNYKPPIAEDEKTNSWFTAVLKGLVLGIGIDGITDFFESVIKMINKSFDFNKWYKGLNDSFRDFSNELMMNFVTIMNTIFSGLSENLLNDFYEHINDYTKGEIINLIFGEFFSSILDIFDLFNSIKHNFDGTQSIDYSFVSTFVDIITAIICIFVPYASFSAEEIKKMIKDSLKNIENGNFWG